ncbi:MAG: 3-deoxy-manno-octulosonate cytidylyltransferase, partial [Sutterella sp.]
MSFTVIIPARLKSTRLPNKPLADIGGKPMIVRVAERALQSGAERVAVALDDESVAGPCRQAGLNVIMTSPDHPTGTDRLSEAARKLGLADDDIVVNLQGDEPLMPVGVIRDVAALLESRPDCAMATAAHT